MSGRRARAIRRAIKATQTPNAKPGETMRAYRKAKREYSRGR